MTARLQRRASRRASAKDICSQLSTGSERPLVGGHRPFSGDGYGLISACQSLNVYQKPSMVDGCFGVPTFYNLNAPLQPWPRRSGIAAEAGTSAGSDGWVSH